MQLQKKKVMSSNPVKLKIFMDICGKSSMRDGLIDILLSASKEIFMGKKPHSVE